MLQLKNNTPFSAAMAMFPNEQGVDTLYTIVKATFNIGQQWTLPDEQLEPQKEDVYWGKPAESSVRFSSDYHTGKASTDIIMTGMACSREQQLVRQMDVSLSVGNLNKTIRVFGDRRWDQGRISSPEAFASIPLIYERAFGGKDVVDGQNRAMEGRNPVGRGFAGHKKESEINGMFLPNIESPHDLIQHYQDAPVPQGFAPIASSWYPRAHYAGTYDERWQKNRAPYLPEDYNQKFMNVSHPDLIASGFLKGGEPVKISGMHPLGELAFNLPVLNLVNKVLIGGKEIASAFLLETVHLDPNQLQISLVFRSSFVCDKKALKITQIAVSMLR